MRSHPTRRAVCAASALIGAFPWHAFAQGGRVLELPRFAVGDEWTLADLDYTSGGVRGEFGHKVADVRADSIMVEGTDELGRSFRRRYSLELNRLRGEDKQNELAVKFPMTAGSEWDAKYHVASQKTRGTDYDLTRRATAWESIQTAAGTLECMRIESSGIWSGDRGRNGRYEGVHWYSPAAKHIARFKSRRWERAGGAGSIIVSETAWELAKFSVAP